MNCKCSPFQDPPQFGRGCALGSDFVAYSATQLLRDSALSERAICHPERCDSCDFARWKPQSVGCVKRTTASWLVRFTPPCGFRHSLAAKCPKRGIPRPRLALTRPQPFVTIRPLLSLPEDKGRTMKRLAIAWLFLLGSFLLGCREPEPCSRCATPCVASLVRSPVRSPARKSARRRAAHARRSRRRSPHCNLMYCSPRPSRPVRHSRLQHCRLALRIRRRNRSCSDNGYVRWHAVTRRSRGSACSCSPSMRARRFAS